MRRSLPVAGLVLLLAAAGPGLATTGATAGAAGMTARAAGTTARTPQPKTSLTAIWNDVMCVLCHEPLSVAQSPQATEEKQVIRALVAQGETKPQILRALVGQYGPAVLGKPPASGFDLTVYILPPVILAIGVIVLLVTLPKWRARSRIAAAAPMATGQALSSEDSARLDRDLARFG